MEVLLVLLSVFMLPSGTEKLLPRGISRTQRQLYDSLQDFTCLDGTIRLPFDFVNDDFCDCPDGSDEPGTSACPNGLFHCHNIGFLPLDVPASRVNDGICDCCDGSDEYVAGNCINICLILGAEARKAAEKEEELAIQGNELRLQMINTGKALRIQKQERLSALESERVEAQRLKDKVRMLKQIAESIELAALKVYRLKKEEQKEAEAKFDKENLEQEARIVFNQLDTNADNVLQAEEFMVRNRSDQKYVIQDFKAEHKHYFNSNQEISWESFLYVWPKVKTLVLENEQQEITENKQDDYDERTEDNKPVIESSVDFNVDNVNTDRETTVEWEQIIEPKDSEESIEQEAEEGELEDKQKEMKRQEVEENKVDDIYDEQTLKFIDLANKVRSRFQSAERSVHDIERELIRLKDSLKKDYGPEDEFILLDGQCYSYSDRKYTYKLYPFDQVVQMGKSGGSETRLGNWAGWLEGSQHKIMLYDKGQTCWNGPQRSTKVTLLCGLKTAVIEAFEPLKCEYELTLQTPAACKAPIIQQPVDAHDEF